MNIYASECMSVPIISCCDICEKCFHLLSGINYRMRLHNSKKPPNHTLTKEKWFEWFFCLLFTCVRFISRFHYYPAILFRLSDIFVVIVHNIKRKKKWKTATAVAIKYVNNTFKNINLLFTFGRYVTMVMVVGKKSEHKRL